MDYDNVENHVHYNKRKATLIALGEKLQISLDKSRNEIKNLKLRVSGLTRRYNLLVAEKNRQLKVSHKHSKTIGRERRLHKGVKENLLKRMALMRKSKLAAAQRNKASVRHYKKKYAKLIATQSQRVRVKVAASNKRITSKFLERIVVYRKRIISLRTMIKRRDNVIVEKISIIKELSKKLAVLTRIQERHKLVLDKLRSEKLTLKRQLNGQAIKYENRIKRINERLKKKPKVQIRYRTKRVERVREVVPEAIRKFNKYVGDGATDLTINVPKYIELNLRMEKFFKETSLTLSDVNTIMIINEFGNLTTKMYDGDYAKTLRSLFRRGFVNRTNKDSYFLTATGETLCKRYLEVVRKRTIFVGH